MHVVCANIFGANVLKSRFKIDVVIMIMIEQEADSLRAGKKRPGGDIAPPAKKPRSDVPRPRWVDQAETPVVMHGGYEASRGRPWFRPRGFGRGRFRRAGGGNRGSRFF